MDNLKLKIGKYQIIVEEYIRDLVNSYNASLGSDSNYHGIIDLKTNHFQLVRIGWDKEQFLYGVLIHLSINKKTGNIWIHQNNTEIEIDEDLKKIANIPKEHFVLGFYPDYVREHSEYAVA